MRKILLILVLFIFTAACATQNEGINEERSNTPEEKATSESDDKEIPAHQAESIFTYEVGEDDRYEFRGLDASIDGSTILFSTKEEIKRKENDVDYIIRGDKEPVELIELSNASPEDLDDSNCSRTFISPNGQYVTFSCSLDERWFVVYDTDREEIIHHQPELEEYGFRMFGITDNMEMLLEDTNGSIVAIYDLETEEMKEFNIAELSGVEDEIFTDIYLADNGKKIFMHNLSRIYVLDTETGDLNTLMDVKPYEERFKEVDGITLGNLRVSPNGKYVYYRISDTSSDDIYRSSNFVNVESGETYSFNNFGYKSIATIDNNGNIIISDGDHIYLYQIDNGTNHLISAVDPSTFIDEITLTGDGSTLLYTDRMKDTEVKTYAVFHLTIEDAESYEVVDFDATEEDTEELLGEASNDTNDSVESGTVALYPVEEDIRKIYEDTWEKSADIPFPTEFPAEVDRIYDNLHSNSFGQTILLNSESFTTRGEINYRANTYPDSDRNNFCIDDDLELEETIEGIDYYFYLFHNEEVELAYVEDDVCYSFEGKGFSKDEMFAIVDSMELQGKRPTEIPLDIVKFPTVVPINNVEITRIHVSKIDAEKYTFHVDYRGEADDLKVNYEISYEEPNFYDHDESLSVTLDNSLEAYYNEPNLRLFIFDGNYYYTIRVDAESELIQEFGGSEAIKEALIEVGNTVE